jgi:long-chain acyl-CoA synthetase
LSQIADSVVLSGVRAATGGRLRLALSGGAALSLETQEFLTVALVTMLQGASYFNYHGREIHVCARIRHD